MTTATAPIGCPFVIGKVKKWNSGLKQYEMTAIFCHKMPAKDSSYCPRHKLVAEELAKHEKRVGDYQSGA